MTMPEHPSTLITNSAHTNYVAGVDIGGTNLRVALADMEGTIKGKWSCSIAGAYSEDKIVKFICDGVEHLLQQLSAPRHALQSIAAGAPGVTDVDQGIVIVTSYLMGWRNVPLRTLLEEALHVPAAVDNDVNLAAVGENWTGTAKGISDFVFLAIGTGIGAGIVLNGRPFHGTNWAAGEIGYMLVPGIQDLPVERGQPGMLESIIGGEGIKTQWKNLWDPQKTTLPKELTATEIFDHALSGDTLARTILHNCAHMLSLVIYNISLVLNCPLFVLGGGVGTHPALYSETQSILEQRNMRRQPQLVRSALGPDAQLAGALRLALDTAKSHAVLVVEETAKNHVKATHEWESL